MKLPDLLRPLFGRQTPQKSAGNAQTDPGDARLAACALFLEMARADGQFSGAERDRVLAILKNDYHLSDEEALRLVQEADQELEESIDLWHFTNRINQNCSENEKIRIIRMLWKIVYEDGTLDKHERYLVNKLSTLLRLTHEDLIDAKMTVIAEGKASAD